MKSELSIALKVTPASCERWQLRTYTKLTGQRFKPRFFMLDAGYDQMKKHTSRRD
ncbi:hypothetical protein [Paenibacillus odorifer]